MNVSTSIEKNVNSIDSIIEEFSRIEEKIKVFDIYVEPFIITTNRMLSLSNQRKEEKIVLYFITCSHNNI